MPNPHPIIVHFAIGLFVTAIVAEILAYFLKSKLWNLVALVNGGIATAAAFAAVVTGLMAKPLVTGGPAVFVLESHETMGYLVLATALVFTGLKFYGHWRPSERFVTATVGAGLLGLVFTVIAAHEGGELVYRFGVGVRKDAPQEVQKYPYGRPLTAPADSTGDSTSTPPGN